ncbi:MAG: hypothetical protein LBB88_07825 [Planctomycetaceae bacterium]|nr:hypothetical protein [Planctomycetaceae bacterium]
MDSTIIKINSDLPSANADATFRGQQVRNMSLELKTNFPLKYYQVFLI